MSPLSAQQSIDIPLTPTVGHPTSRFTPAKIQRVFAPLPLSMAHQFTSQEEPSEDEIQQRQQQYHQPYHDALEQQLDRVHQRHGYVLLYDCHSIRSLVPYLFEGKLADFNIGTNSGHSCSPGLESAVLTACVGENNFTHVLNGRFKGGWTTRHYGNPQAGYHAIQMELAQCNYMLEEAPWSYDIERAEMLRISLQNILQCILKV